MPFKDILLKQIIPGGGCVLAWVVYLSPWKAGRHARVQRDLGDFNPIPLVALAHNCLGWTVYSCMLQDYYIFAGNQPGVLITAFIAAQCFGVAPLQIRDKMMWMGLIMTFIQLSTGFVVGFLEQQTRVFVWGCLNVAILLVFYTSPLSVMMKVVRTKSAAAIYAPLAIAATVNAALWSGYGFALGDPFVFCPNTLGVLTGLIQIAMTYIYRERAQDASHRSTLSDKNTPLHKVTFGALPSQDEEDDEHGTLVPIKGRPQALYNGTV